MAIDASYGSYPKSLPCFKIWLLCIYFNLSSRTVSAHYPSTEIKKNQPLPTIIMNDIVPNAPKKQLEALFAVSYKRGICQPKP